MFVLCCMRRMLFSFDKSVDGVVFDSMGSGGHSEFLDHLHEAKAMYGLLRLLSGDRESRRVKYVVANASVCRRIFAQPLFRLVADLHIVSMFAYCFLGRHG